MDLHGISVTLCAVFISALLGFSMYEKKYANKYSHWHLYCNNTYDGVVRV